MSKRQKKDNEMTKSKAVPKPLKSSTRIDTILSRFQRPVTAR